MNLSESDKKNNTPSKCACEPNKIHVPAAKIQIQTFYKQPIPDVTRQIYDLFGIRYVHVKSKDVDYYIYEGSLASVVSELGLWA